MTKIVTPHSFHVEKKTVNFKTVVGHTARILDMSLEVMLSTLK